MEQKLQPWVEEGGTQYDKYEPFEHNNAMDYADMGFEEKTCIAHMTTLPE